MLSSSSGNRRRISAIILAGGQSSRMGQDKALLPWHGRTVIEHLVAQLQELSDDVLVITGPAIRYRELLDVPIFADEVQNGGPMGGLYTGLKQARHEYSLTVACDMPLLEQRVLEMLVGEIASSVWAVVSEVEGHRVPILAIYSVKCVSVIELLLSEKRTSLQELVNRVSAKIVSEHRLRQIDPLLQSFTKLNTPEDWSRLLK